MKKYALLSIILLIALAVFATNASADLLISSVTLGDDSQARGENVTASITLTNNGTGDITNLNFQVLNSDQNKYKFEFQNAPTSVTAGQQASVTLQAEVPEDFDAVDEELEEMAFKIGDLKVSGTEGSTNREATADLNMQAENNLEFKKVKVEFADKSESVDDGDKVDSIKPDDKLTFTIEVENRFTDKEDVDIEDIEVMIDVDDGDFSDSDDDDLGDLNADDDDEVTLSLEVDDDADDGTYKADLTLEGTDENGARHGEKWEIKLEVERKTHEIIIQRTSISPTTVTCLGRRRADLFINIENTGRRDEDEVTVEVIVGNIGFRDSRTDIELDRDDSESMTFPIYIPESAKGDIDIVIKTFFDNDKQSDEKIVRLGVELCEVEEEEEEESEVTTPVTQPVQPVPPAAPTGSATAQTTTRASAPSSGNTGLFIALLIIGIVIVLALLALLIVKLVK